MVHKLVLVAWALSLLFSIPQTFIFSYKLTPHGQMDCWASFEPMWTLPLYITIFTVLVYILPTVVLTFCYGSICLEVWRSSRNGIGVSQTSTNQRHSHKICRTPKTSIENMSINHTDFLSESDKRFIVQDGKHVYSNGTNAEENGTPHTRLQSETMTNHNTQTPLKGIVTAVKNIRERTSSDASNSFRERTTSNCSKVRDRTTSDAASRTSVEQKKGTGGITKAKMKTVKMTLTVVLCYFLCWSPFFIAQMWAAWDENAPFYGKNSSCFILVSSLCRIALTGSKYISPIHVMVSEM